MTHNLLSDPPPLHDSPTFRIVGEAPALFAALAKAQAAFGPVVKNRTVHVRSDKGNYSFEYATLDVVFDATRAALNANELAIIQPFTAQEDACELRTMLVHASGSYLELRYTFPKPLDIQKLGSALTYIRRYSVASLLGLSSEEDDDGNVADGNQRDIKSRGNPPAPPKAQNRPQERPAPKEEPRPQPKAASAPQANVASAAPKTEPIEPQVIESTGVLVAGEDGESTLIPDDPKGSNGSVVPEGEPAEWSDPHPGTDASKRLIVKTMNKILSVSGGAAKDIPMPIRTGIWRVAAHAELRSGFEPTEGQCQRVLAFLYSTAKDQGFDPDMDQLSKADVEKCLRAVEHRTALQ